LTGVKLPDSLAETTPERKKNNKGTLIATTYTRLGKEKGGEKEFKAANREKWRNTRDPYQKDFKRNEAKLASYSALMREE